MVVADEAAGKQILVPLTTSLYVPGTLASTDTVIVDVGTGFYVEKVCRYPRGQSRMVLGYMCGLIIVSSLIRRQRKPISSTMIRRKS